MNFDLTDEQQMLNDSLRRFVTNEYSFEKRSTFIESGKGTLVDQFLIQRYWYRSSAVGGSSVVGMWLIFENVSFIDYWLTRCT